MRKLLLAALLFAAVFPASAAVNCPRQPKTERGALQAEMLWVRALETKNTELLDCILAPGFADAAWNGDVWPREQILKSLPQRKPHSIHLSDVRAHVDGDKAVVRGVNTLVKPNGGVLATLDFMDMFVYRDGRWRALTAQETLRR
jgi:Domain of unknown function (DUF4440)